MTVHELAPLPESATPGAERILIAVDGGSGSRAALRWAADHLSRAPGYVMLVCVAPEETLVQDADAELRAASLALGELAEGADIATQVRQGKAVEQLLLAAEELRADLLVVGTHASVERPQSGRVTVAGRLAARASCTTVVVPADWSPSDGPIVVGCSVDSASEVAVDYAYDLAARTARRLVLAHVWDLPTIGEMPITPGGGESIPDRQKKALDGIVQATSARGLGVEVTAELRKGAAVDGLIEAVDDPSLLVVGRRARPAVARMILGSTSRGLVSAPPCAVAVVPAPEPGIHVYPELVPEDL